MKKLVWDKYEILKRPWHEVLVMDWLAPLIFIIFGLSIAALIARFAIVWFTNGGE